MPTVLTHPAVALAVVPWYRDLARHGEVIAIAIVLSVIPDLDVVAFAFDVPYADMLGHRGLTHSIPFALIVALLTALVVRVRTPLSLPALWSYFAICMASHGLLDACTNGGLGVAFFSPFSNERFFFPWRPLEVSPIGIQSFVSNRGAAVLVSEGLWVWLPCLGLGLAGLLWSRRQRP